MLPLGLRGLWSGPDLTENPVSLSKEQVQHIATLARLQLEDGEFDNMIDKLSRIIDFVDQLQAHLNSLSYISFKMVNCY